MKFSKRLVNRCVKLYLRRDQRHQIRCFQRSLIGNLNNCKSPCNNFCIKYLIDEGYISFHALLVKGLQEIEMTRCLVSGGPIQKNIREFRVQ